MYQGNSRDKDFENLPTFWKNVLGFFDRLVRYGGRLLDAPPEPKKPVKNWTIIWFYLFHIIINIGLLILSSYIISYNYKYFSEEIHTGAIELVLIISTLIVLSINIGILFLGIWGIIGNQYSKITIYKNFLHHRTNIILKIAATSMGIFTIYLGLNVLFIFISEGSLGNGTLGIIGIGFLFSIFYAPTCLISVISERIYLKSQYKKVSTGEYLKIEEEYNNWKKEKMEIFKNF